MPKIQGGPSSFGAAIHAREKQAKHIKSSCNRRGLEKKEGFSTNKKLSLITYFEIQKVRNPFPHFQPSSALTTWALAFTTGGLRK